MKALIVFIFDIDPGSWQNATDSLATVIRLALDAFPNIVILVLFKHRMILAVIEFIGWGSNYL